MTKRQSPFGIVRLITIIVLAGMVLALPAVFADGFIIIPPQPPNMPPHPQPPEPLSVKYHHVKVAIKNQVAVIDIDQEFSNPNSWDLEGWYIFPIPEAAAIRKFSLYIEGNEVNGEVLDKDKARAIYEDIVRRMRDPALLEYVGRDMFKARVYPIPAHGSRRVKLSYTQTLTQQMGLVPFSYPLNTERFSSQPIEDVTVDIGITSAVPIKTVYCPSHEVEITRKSATEARVVFEARRVKPDRDLQVYYSVSEGDVGLNLMTYRQKGEDGFFLMMISPNSEAAETEAMPKTVIFAIDTSGSMQGKKLEQAKAALTFAINSLEKSDSLAVVRFSTEAEVFSGGLVSATEDNKQKALNFIEKFKAAGGTNIEGALKQVGDLAAQEKDKPVITMFLTDGLPTVGTKDIKTLVNLLGEKNQRTRLFALGVGYDVNTHLLDELAKQHRGRSEYVKPEEDLEVKVSNLYKQISMPVLTDLKLTGLDKIGAYSLMPQELPDLFYGSELLITGRYRKADSVSLELRGTARGKSRSFTVEGTFPQSDSSDDFIPHIWATRRVGYLMDEIRLHGENQELKDEIVQLSKEYGIITPYTSFLVTEDGAKSKPAENMTTDQMRRLGYTDGKAGGAASNAPPAASVQRSFQDKLPSGESMKKMTRAESGKEAVDLSDSAGNMQAAKAPMAQREKPADSGTPESMKRVGTHTFYLTNEIWTDSKFKSSMKLETIVFNSDEYFKLLTQEPELSKYLPVGKNLIVVLGERAFKITEKKE